MTGSQAPAATLEHEHDLFAAGYQLVAGVDEVGRGSLAGVLSVGVAVIGAQAQLQVAGLIDSKALSPARREKMVPEIRRWCLNAVGHVSPAEIDELGMTLSLRLAAQRALARLGREGTTPEVVLLDGKHDWLSAPAPDLLGHPGSRAGCGTKSFCSRRGGTEIRPGRGRFTPLLREITGAPPLRPHLY